MGFFSSLFGKEAAIYDCQLRIISLKAQIAGCTDANAKEKLMQRLAQEQEELSMITTSLPRPLAQAWKKLVGKGGI